MTFGDVLAVVASALALVVTLWAGTLVFALLFAKKARVAADAATAHPARLGFGGAALGVLAGGAGLALANAGGFAIIGWVMLGLLLALALLGSAGLSLLLADRMRAEDRRLRPLAALGKSSLLLIGAGLIPIAGWFALFPALLFVSLGAGLIAVLDRRPRQAEAAVTAPLTVPAEPGA